jgi:acyl-CoA synthetase (AMP-forming)/AMP-acid ligase II
MIIRGGLNIAPKEVEDVLSSHDAVAIAAVVGADDVIFGQVVKAYVVPRDPEDCAGLVEALKLRCASMLSRAKVPVDIVLMRHLPMNAGGKVLRQVLREAEPIARIDM